jgi:RNA polymerase sigma-70 factor (ECF subfamily)
MSELATAADPALDLPREFAHARDAALVRAASAGDRVAFQKLYDAHSPRAYRLAYGVLLDRDEAREAVQEAFFRLHKAGARWEPNAAVSTWLHRVVLNHCLSLRRRLFRFGRTAAPRSAAPSPEKLAHRGRAIAIVERCLAALPPRERAMLTLYLDEDLKPTEIAGLVGMTPNATRVALHRSVKRLREDLARAGIEDASEPEDAFADLEEDIDANS